MRGKPLDWAFRERLMLAVTAVNGCRYCSYGHARQALSAGVTPAEIEALAGGQFDGCPAEELPALLYAQHWAEADGHPDPAARARMSAIYGDEQARAIELALRIIRVGNLSGNTLDHVLHRLTLGRIGGGERRQGPGPARGGP
jgi:AhpD family alkylhydroperoxidase